MVFPDFNPVIVQLGPFALRWYALAYIAGILLGWRYGVGLVRNAKLWGPATPTATVAQIDDLIVWITLGVILGGRIGYVLFYMLPSPSEREMLAANPLEALAIWHGGMSFHGGVIGVGAGADRIRARQPNRPAPPGRPRRAPASRSASSSAASPTSSTASSGDG